MSSQRSEGSAPDGSLGFLHVDMDAFFVSCELRRRPELIAEPVVVGGTGDRGVVAAASYVARSYGIYSAMPTTRARRLCPHAVFLTGDHAYYGEVSGKVMALFRDVTPLVEPLSLDEAFLDVRGALHGRDRAPTIAAELRARVLAEEQLTCSVGVATNKFLAKLATGRAKPKPSATGPIFGTGVHVIKAGTELDFLQPLAVGALWGVGPATGAKLSRMGIETVGDLAAQPEERVTAALGSAVGRHLHLLSQGRDERPVIVDQGVKSIGHEETFAHDIFVDDRLSRELVRMADAVASRLRAANVAGRTITVKVRFGDFTTITRSVTLLSPIDGARSIAHEAGALLARVDTSPGVRLLGVSASQLVEPHAQQLSFDDVEGRSWSDADGVVDEIRERFGGNAIGPATLSRPGSGLRRMERGQQQWGPDRNL